VTLQPGETPGAKLGVSPTLALTKPSKYGSRPSFKLSITALSKREWKSTESTAIK